MNKTNLRDGTDWLLPEICCVLKFDVATPGNDNSPPYTLKNEVGLSARRNNFLSSQVAERFPTVAGLVQVP